MSKLDSWREIVKPPEEDLLVEPPEIKPHRKVGRPPKKKDEALTQRISIVLTSYQRGILSKKRGAGKMGEIEESTFIREWLRRTKCFDARTTKKWPPENLPPELE